jgi:CHAT domain-containing protein/tetratricopeptide (TPR) repeat protein
VAALCSFIFFLLLCLQPEPAWTAIATPADSDNPIQIAFGASIRREVAAGGKDLFGISVGQGQMLRLVVDKGDVALSTALYGPTGAKLFEQVSRDYETVETSFPADVAGTYRIAIQSLETAGPSRQYELRVQPVTSITAGGRRDSEAREEMAGAAALRATWTEVSLRKAIEKYDEAALTWTIAGDLTSAARAMIGSGDVCFLLSEYHDALKRYQNASQMAARRNDRLNEATALSRIGRLYSYLGDNDLAQKQLTKALDFFESDEAGRTHTVRHAFGEALSNLCEVSYAKGDLVKSSAQFERARKVFSEINDRGGEAKVHLFEGYIAGSLGEPEKGTAEISRALELYRAVSDRDGEGLSLTALGLSHSLKRDEDGAIKLHRQAIETFRAIGDGHSEAIALNALGQAYENLSEYSIALDSYEQALRLFQNSGALDLAAVAMFKVAKIYRLSGDLDQALSYYQRCLTLSRAAGKVRTEANALDEVATMYITAGNREQALKQYWKIRRFYQTIGDRRGEAVAENNYGDFLLRLGKKEAALAAYGRALPLSEKAGDKGILISTLYNLARAHRDLGSLDIALSYIKQSIRAIIKQSIRAIEDLRMNVGSPDLRASYFSGVRRHYDLCIDILMQLDHAQPGKGFAAAALLASENNRARSLRDLLTESRADVRRGAPPELLDREIELRALLRSQAQYAMELSTRRRNSTEIDEVAIQMDRLRSEYQEVQAQLRDGDHRLLSLERPAPLNLEQIQDQLRYEDTMLLEYALGDERSYLWVITRDSLQSYELPARKIIEDVAVELYKMLTARQEFDKSTDDGYQAKVETSDKLYFEKAGKLSQFLLGPVAAQLGTRRLVVVAEGALQYIPIDALPVPLAQADGSTTLETQSGEDGQLLAQNHEIVALPSISTLLAIRAERRQPTSRNKVVAVLADPVFSPQDERVPNGTGLSQASLRAASGESVPPGFEGLVRSGGPARLTHASEEADAILAVAPRGTGMVAKGFDASRETAMSSRIGQYQIVHFATHTFLDSKRPEFSGVVLTMVDRNGAGQNGLMLLHDIYNLDLSAELTVLSACDTALGKDIKGEGLVGLTHSFMAAGSKSVVASLWKVDDRATAVLMANFYQSMLQDGMRPAAALGAAKLKLRQDKRWGNPYFWAGFVFQGEYLNRIVVDGNSSPRVGLVLSSVLILISLGLLLFHRRRLRLFRTPLA